LRDRSIRHSVRLFRADGQRDFLKHAVELARASADHAGRPARARESETRVPLPSDGVQELQQHVDFANRVDQCSLAARTPFVTGSRPGLAAPPRSRVALTDRFPPSQPGLAAASAGASQRSPGSSLARSARRPIVHSGQHAKCGVAERGPSQSRVADSLLCCQHPAGARPGLAQRHTVGATGLLRLIEHRTAPLWGAQQRGMPPAHAQRAATARIRHYPTEHRPILRPMAGNGRPALAGCVCARSTDRRQRPTCRSTASAKTQDSFL
jgi:hypothetical protein